METINNRVKMFRETLGLTNALFSQKLNVKSGTISMLETGTSKPGAEILGKISEVFGADLNWLVNGEGEMFKDGKTPEITPTPIKVKEVKTVASNEIVDVSLYQKLVNSLEDRCKELSEQLTYFKKQNEMLIAK